MQRKTALSDGLAFVEAALGKETDWIKINIAAAAAMVPFAMPKPHRLLDSGNSSIIISLNIIRKIAGKQRSDRPSKRGHLLYSLSV